MPRLGQRSRCGSNGDVAMNQRNLNGEPWILKEAYWSKKKNKTKRQNAQLVDKQADRHTGR